MLRWLGREDAPLLFRPRADWAQWVWGLRFLRECMPGRFERNTRAARRPRRLQPRLRCARCAPDRHPLRRARARHPAFLHRASAISRTLARHTEAMRALGVEREVKTAAECVAIEPALAYSEDRVVGGAYAPQDESGDAHRSRASSPRLRQAHGVAFRYGVRQSRRSSRRATSSLRCARRTASASPLTPTWSRSAATARCCCAPLGIRIPVYPAQGLFDHAAARARRGAGGADA